MATTRWPPPCSNARWRARRPHRPGSISAWSGRICATTTAPPAAYRKALEKKPDHAEAALNLGTVLQETGDLDGAMRAYAAAYRLRPDMFGTIAMALTSAPHGRLWLDEAALRRSLGGLADHARPRRARNRLR